MLFLFLQVFIQPVEVASLPEDAVLWLEYPVVLVWEAEELGWDATEACCVEGRHGL